MMMAIINLAFEEIKSNKSDFQNKFELVDYVKRTTKEMIGTRIAEPIVPVYSDKQGNLLKSFDKKTVRRKGVSIFLLLFSSQL